MSPAGPGSHPLVGETMERLATAAATGRMLLLATVKLAPPWRRWNADLRGIGDTEAAVQRAPRAR